MVSRPLLLPRDLQGSGGPRCGPVRLKNLAPAPKVFQLEARSILCSSGRSTPKLATLPTALCVPTFLPDWRMSEESNSSPIRTIAGRSTLAHSTVVSNPAKNGNQPAVDFTITPVSSEGTQRGNTPPSGQSNSHTDSLVGIGEGKGTKPLSKPVIDLLANPDERVLEKITTRCGRNSPAGVVEGKPIPFRVI